MNAFLEALARMTPGEALGWVTGISTLVIAFWTQFGKSRDTVFSRIDAERKQMTEDRDKAKADLLSKAAELNDCEENTEKIRQENDFLKSGHRALIDFLEDVAGGSYGPDWVKKRAEQLLARYKV